MPTKHGSIYYQRWAQWILALVVKRKSVEIITVKDEWPDAISDGLTLKCQCCGHLPYVDYGVDDETWKMIVPKYMRLGVVCFRCLDELATEKNIDITNHLIRFQFTGIGKTIEMTPTRVFYHL